LTNVTFLGRWPIQDIARLMSIGDVHLVSLRQDPLAEVAMPSKVPATLASGKPIIVAAQGEAAGVVSRSGAGWTCIPGDRSGLEAAIRSALAAGPNKLGAMGQKALEAYQAEFAVAIGVDRIEQLLVGGRVRAEYAN
jgi:glycosyltransferase involved in cell wall biosynthesis